MPLFWPQPYETRNQSQEKKKIWKEHKYMEIKHQATKQWMIQPKNQRRNKKMETNEN